ncbi:hypothetical protein Ct61P_05917 [Colletotrichum tofieldiae]|nr:hypothetical protein Ct61P_05917 [Colletotrichum tofieldiae]
MLGNALPILAVLGILGILPVAVKVLLVGLATGHNGSVLDSELDNETLLLAQLVLQLVAIEEAQAHERPPVGRVLDETVSARLAAARLGNLGALATLELDLGLTDDTLALQLALVLAILGLLRAPDLLLLGKGLTLALLDILGELDAGLAGQLLELLGADIARDVADGQTGQTDVQRRVALDELLALLGTVFSHLDLVGALGVVFADGLGNLQKPAVHSVSTVLISGIILQHRVLGREGIRLCARRALDAGLRILLVDEADEASACGAVGCTVHDNTGIPDGTELDELVLHLLLLLCGNLLLLLALRLLIILRVFFGTVHLVPFALVHGPVNRNRSSINDLSVHLEGLFSILPSSEGHKTETLELALVLGQVGELDNSVSPEKSTQLRRCLDRPGQVANDQLGRFPGLLKLLRTLLLLTGSGRSNGALLAVAVSGFGNIDSDAASLPHHIVELLLGFHSIFGIRQGDEAIASGSLGGLVENDGRMLDWEMLGEEVGQRFAGGGRRKRADEERAVGLGAGFLCLRFRCRVCCKVLGDGSCDEGIVLVLLCS